MKNLYNKKILLIICGGIAAYKSLELIRIFKKNIDSNIENTLLKFPTLIKRPIWEVNSKAKNHLIPGFLDDHKKYLKNLNK